MMERAKKLSLSAVLIALFIIICSAQSVSASSNFSLELTGTVDGDVCLEWDNPYADDYDYDCDLYEIKKKEGSGPWKTIDLIEEGLYKDEMTYYDEDVRYGANVSYQVIGYFTYEDYYSNEAESFTEYSEIESLTYKYVKAPEISAIYAGPGSVQINWTKIDKASGYEIYSYNASKGTYALVKTIKDGAKTSWMHENLKANTKYSYKIKSYGYYNKTKYTSDYSLKESATTKSAKFKLTRTKTKAGNIQLKWSDPFAYSDESECTSFEIYRKTSANSKWVKLKTKKTEYYESDYTYTDTNVPYGVTAYYKIKVNGITEYWDSDSYDYHDFAWSTTTPIVSMKTKAAKVPKLQVKYTNSSTALKLSWNKVNKAAGYQIYAYNAKKGKFTLVKTIKNGSTTTWTHKGLKTGSTKSYKIKSYGFRNNKKYFSDLSSVVKKKVTKNQRTWNPSSSFDDYGGPNLRDKSVSYSNGKLKYKALVLNDRIFYANKFDWIRISIYKDGNLIGQQKFYNKSINLDGYDMKYMTFTLDKGTKKVVNLRDGNISVEWQYYYTYTY